MLRWTCAFRAAISLFTAMHWLTLCPIVNGEKAVFLELALNRVGCSTPPVAAASDSLKWSNAPTTLASVKIDHELLHGNHLDRWCTAAVSNVVRMLLNRWINGL